MSLSMIQLLFNSEFVFLNLKLISVPLINQQPYHPAAQDCLPTEAKQGWAWSVPGWEKTRLLLEEVLVRPCSLCGS